MKFSIMFLKYYEYFEDSENECPNQIFLSYIRMHESNRRHTVYTEKWKLLEFRIGIFFCVLQIKIEKPN